MGERAGRDGDSHARKHLQRIGLTRVFNPARGFLAGGIKRGTGKKGREKRLRERHALNRIARHKGFGPAQSKERGKERERERERGGGGRRSLR